MDWEPPADQRALGSASWSRHYDVQTPDELLDLPPLSAEHRCRAMNADDGMRRERGDARRATARLDLADACASGCAGSAGRRYWRSLEELAEHARVRGAPAPRVPAPGRRVAGRARAGAASCSSWAPRWPRRPRPAARGSRREDRPLRQAAGGDRPRQAALLRHRDAARRATRPACWSRATRAGRPRSRATPSTRRASARPTPSPRRRSSASTIPTARRSSPTSGGSAPGASFVDELGAALRGAAGAAAAPGCASSPRPSTSPTLAAQIQRAPRRATRRPSGTSYEPAGRDAARAGARARLRRDRSRRATTSPSADVVARARRRLPRRRARRACATRATSRAAAGVRAGDAPTMNRLYAVESTPTLDRRRGRPPPAAARRARSRRSRSPSRAALGVAGARAGAPTPKRARSWLAAVARDLQAHRGRSARRRRRARPPRRPRAGPRDQRSARQRRHDGRLHRAGRGRAGRPARVARASWSTTCSAGRVELLLDPRRQPGLRRAGRPRLRRARSHKVAAARPPRPLRRRDRRALPLARPRGALPREPGATPAPSTARCRSSSR